MVLKNRSRSLAVRHGDHIRALDHQPALRGVAACDDGQTCLRSRPLCAAALEHNIFQLDAVICRTGRPEEGVSGVTPAKIVGAGLCKLRRRTIRNREVETGRRVLANPVEVQLVINLGQSPLPIGRNAQVVYRRRAFREVPARSDRLGGQPPVAPGERDRFHALVAVEQNFRGIGAKMRCAADAPAGEHTRCTAIQRQVYEFCVAQLAELHIGFAALLGGGPHHNQPLPVRRKDRVGVERRLRGNLAVRASVRAGNPDVAARLAYPADGRNFLPVR